MKLIKKISILFAALAMAMTVTGNLAFAADIPSYIFDASLYNVGDVVAGTSWLTFTGGTEIQNSDYGKCLVGAKFNISTPESSVKIIGTAVKTEAAGYTARITIDGAHAWMTGVPGTVENMNYEYTASDFSSASKSFEFVGMIITDMTIYYDDEAISFGYNGVYSGNSTVTSGDTITVPETIDVTLSQPAEYLAEFTDGLTINGEAAQIAYDGKKIKLGLENGFKYGTTYTIEFPEALKTKVTDLPAEFNFSTVASDVGIAKDAYGAPVADFTTEPKQCSFTLNGTVAREDVWVMIAVYGNNGVLKEIKVGERNIAVGANPLVTELLDNAPAATDTVKVMVWDNSGKAIIPTISK